jgi:hypothetical protein
MAALQEIERVLLIGIGATVVLDSWLVLLGRMGVPTLNFAYIGRWVGHLLRGKFAHAAIARAEPIKGERAWGWLAHYAIGIAFAALLVGSQGAAWARQPTLGPALRIGLCTVLAPLFVMQPAMGAGIASSRTATPVKNVLRSVANHAVFGLGLYLTSLLAAQFLR